MRNPLRACWRPSPARSRSATRRRATERGSRLSPSRSRAGSAGRRSASRRCVSVRSTTTSARSPFAETSCAKSGPLSIDELAEIRTHPSKGAELVRAAPRGAPCASVRPLPPRALGRRRLSLADPRQRHSARGPTARRRRRVRRDDLAAAVPPCAHARARARSRCALRRHAVRPGDRRALPRGVERAASSRGRPRAVASCA